MYDKTSEVLSKYCFGIVILFLKDILKTLIALSKVDPGRGLTAGICVAFIAITVDRLVTAWSYNRKLELGLN